MFVSNKRGATAHQDVMEPIGLEPTTSCMPCRPASDARQGFTSSAHQICTIRDASVEAVFRWHFDLTTAEAARFAGLDPLVAAQSIGRLRDRGVIEPREPRQCEVFERVMPAWIIAPGALI